MQRDPIQPPMTDSQDNAPLAQILQAFQASQDRSSYSPREAKDSQPNSHYHQSNASKGNTHDVEIVANMPIIVSPSSDQKPHSK